MKRNRTTQFTTAPTITPTCTEPCGAPCGGMVREVTRADLLSCMHARWDLNFIDACARQCSLRAPAGDER